MAKLHGKDLISIHDLTPADVEEILTLAADLKNKQKNGIKHEYLWAKSLAMIFEKQSTRTRVSFEIGMWQLGGLAINLDQEAIGLGVRESIGDVARTLSRFADAILIRTFAHEKVIELAKFASVPIINALSDLEHPCQALSDIFTIRERKGLGKGLKMAYIGDGNNVCHSLMFAAAKVGIDLTVATPKGYEPKVEIAEVAIVHDPVVAAKDADVIYTDVWTSMGQEKEKAKRQKDFAGFQVNEQMMELAKKDCLFMHCLPAHRGEEVTDGVIDSPNSVVFDQAENRLHVQKAILVLLLGGADVHN